MDPDERSRLRTNVRVAVAIGVPVLILWTGGLIAIFGGFVRS